MGKRAWESEFARGVLKLLALVKPAWGINALVGVVSVVVFRHNIDESLHRRTLAGGAKQFTPVVV